MAFDRDSTTDDVLRGIDLSGRRIVGWSLTASSRAMPSTSPSSRTLIGSLVPFLNPTISSMC